MSYKQPPKGDVSRLPRWAQDYIAGLLNEIDRQDKHITSISSPHPGSNVTLSAPVDRPDVTLPPDSTVRFHTGSLRDDREAFEVHHGRRNSRELYVACYSGQMIILPHVSNAVVLRMDRH